MNEYLPILVWFSLWGAVLVFGFMILLYLFLMFMGKEELAALREESDGVMRDVREAEEREKQEKNDARAARRKARLEKSEEESPDAQEDSPETGSKP
jgi:Sec-independent protein translocase protein TatA